MVTANGVKRLKCMEFMFISYSRVDGSNKWLGRLLGGDATILGLQSPSQKRTGLRPKRCLASFRNEQ